MIINDIKIYLIEQMSEMNGVLLSILHELNYSDIKIFKDTETAWKTIQTSTPDLIICDWYPDKRDALRLLKRVRDPQQLNHIPFIIVSGIVEHNMVKQAVAMGVDEYIVKPFNIKIFEEKIIKATQSQSPAIPAFIPDEIKEESVFQTKIAVHLTSLTLLEKVNFVLSDFTVTNYSSLESTIEAAKQDIHIDVIIVEDQLLLANAKQLQHLISLSASGQIEIIALVTNIKSNSTVNTLKASGVKHFIYPDINLESLSTTVDLVTTLKKALLHTKDTVDRASEERFKEVEMQNKLLKSISKESKEILEKSEQIKSSSKESGFAYQLSKDISQRAKTIESISEAFKSISKGVTELEQSPKEHVNLLEIFTNAELLFENTLEQRQLSIVSECNSDLVALANPTLFSSLFMFFMRAIIIDARYQSEIKIEANSEQEKNSIIITISSLMTGYPHLKDITERIWFDKEGTMKFSLKTSLKNLCSSQLQDIHLEFQPDTEVLVITMELLGKDLPSS